MIEDAVRVVERLFRLLQENSTGKQKLIERRFRFGDSSAMLNRSDLDRYKEFVLKLALKNIEISTWTLQIVRHNPNFAREIGDRILQVCGDIHKRVNDLYTEEFTNEMVLEECLSMLRSFADLLGELRSSSN